ncbi:MAG: p-hydroxycinnamoyl-CoA synthetase [Deltaproteobacteria bacterium]|nr:p-hydroxycinnamoyl-CoA synthetase [Deltaproteobacteria bacterium]
MEKSALHNAGGWLARRAAVSGDRVALIEALTRGENDVGPGGARSTTHRTLDYRALEERCARCAAWLGHLGVARGDRVAILLANRAAFLESVFAAARLGAIALPINTRLAPPELRQIFDDAEPRVLLYEAGLEDRVARACAGMTDPPLRLAVGAAPDAYELTLLAHAPDFSVAPVTPDDPMILMYTSGTTGAPKGALLPHRKTLFNSLNAQLFFDCSGRDRVLVVVPLFHSFGLQILSIPALYGGASLVLQRHFDATALWQAVAEHGVTFFGGVPTMFRELLGALDARPDRAELVAKLRFAFTAGAAIPVELIHAFEARGMLLKQGFGQTETSILCCLDARDAIRKAGSVGKPVFHAEVRVVRRDAIDGPTDAWRDVAIGETGEIVVRGPITMTGYWKRPEATTETLREDGWLRTGDLATIDAEGFVTLVGRLRDLFISGGENVYPAQVEETFQQHPDVREIAVVGVPDERFGEVGCAYVVLARGAVLDEASLRSWGRERLATFKVPRSFVAVASLPRTVTGKVQKHRLGAGRTTPSA